MKTSTGALLIMVLILPIMIPSVFGVGAKICATVYLDERYTGYSMDIYDGEVANDVGADLEKQISSLKVSPNCKLTAYKTRGFAGASVLIFYKNKERLGYWNNSIRSYSCKCY